METVVITVNQGELRGNVRKNVDGKSFFSFLGIPFAKPPVCELRFKAPLPAESWKGIRDATKEGDCCYGRPDIIATQLEGSDDCLFLNVFTKELPQSNKNLKPVMVYIFGGGFFSGSSKLSIHGPEFLLTEDIVLVTFNYRTGILGFLSLEDPSLEVPGNAGLKDQKLALEWVQQNIAHFNGDPNNVTIFGESAGSFSVHYHILSQSSKGLFHKAIMQSGVALNYTRGGIDGVAVEFVNSMGHSVGNEKEALKVLQETPVEVLVENQDKFIEKGKLKGRSFGPVLERPNATALVTKSPIDVIISGEYNKVPMVFGYTTREGMVIDALKVIEGLPGIVIDSRPPDSEEVILGRFQLTKGTEIADKVYQQVKEIYFNGPDKEDGGRLLTSDSILVAGILAAVKNHLATMHTPIYLYRMSVESELNYMKNVAHLNHLPGVCHADDLGYLFKKDLVPEIKPGSLEDISFRRFVKLWTNFARYGNPTPTKDGLGVTWLPVKGDQINFLDIGNELIPGIDPEAERMALWEELFQLNPNTAKFCVKKS